VPDADKSKEELIAELQSLRNRLASRELQPTSSLPDSRDEAERRFRALVENSTDVVHVVNAEGFLLFVSLSVTRVLGYQPEEMVGRYSGEFVHPDDHAYARREFDAIVATPGAMSSATFRVRHRDGRWRYVEATASNHLNEPEIRGVVINYRDVTERIQAERERRQLYERLQSFIERVPVACLITGEDDRYVRWNPAAQEIFGWSEEEVIGKHPIEFLVAEEDRAYVAKILERFRSGVTDQSGTNRNRTKDGRIIWCEWTGAPLFDADGKYVGLISMGRDVTQRLVAERERSMLLDRLQMFVERMPIAYLLSGADERYTHWNSAAERMFGWTSAEVQGTHPFDIIVPPEARQGVSDVFARVRQGESNVSGANENLTKDGRRIFCEWTSTPLFDAGGNYSGFVSMARDVTDRMNMQKSLARSEERYRTIVETAGDGIWAVDGEGRTTLVNRRMAELLGEPVAALSGRQLLDFVPDADHAIAAREMRGQRIDGRPESSEFRLNGAGGKEVWVRVSATPSFHDGRFDGSLMMVRDTTERRVLEAQFQQSQKMEAIGRLAGGVAHDFNNLLTIIIGYADLIRETMAPADPNQGLVGEIHKAAERAAALTRQLLAFSRKTILELRVVDLNALIIDSEKMVRRLIGEDIELTTTLDPRLGRIKVDPNQIDQVILNLAVNARDAMPDGGKLTIETCNVELDENYARAHPEARPGPCVLLAISDTGSGMDAATVARIFEPFFTTKQSGKGSGLGLATVYGIVKQSGGHIYVYSELGVGTTFKIYLPRVDDPLPVGGLEPSRRPIAGGRETILLVEDEEGVRRFAQLTLTAAGYKVLAAENGLAALRLATEYPEPIDLLVTDVVMPKLSGRQLAERLLSQRPGLKVLYMSGYTDDAVLRHGVLEAESAFLQKPFSPAGLTEKVRAVLDKAP